MVVRKAASGDIAACVEMLTAYRMRLFAWNSRFWNPSALAVPMTQALLAHLVDQAETFLVAERDGIDGFLIATPIASPPVYDPGGPCVLVDDFCVRDDGLWAEVGGALLDAAWQGWRRRGVARVISVSPEADLIKTAFYQTRGLAPTSRWLSADV